MAERALYLPCHLVIYLLLNARQGASARATWGARSPCNERECSQSSVRSRPLANIYEGWDRGEAGSEIKFAPHAEKSYHISMFVTVAYRSSCKNLSAPNSKKQAARALMASSAAPSAVRRTCITAPPSTTTGCPNVARWSRGVWKISLQS